MDFDIAKENIQPLKGGRNVERLGLALTAAEQKELREALELEKREHEEAIKSYQGVDPLQAWYDYISWIEQSYPKHGNESPLDEVVLKCIMKFEDDPRYKQDRRMIKLYIKYIDTQDNPHEMYQELWNQGIGTLCTDLYIAWSYYYDAMNNFKQAESVFRKGLDACAQPYDELVQAHQNFSFSMSQRLLYDDEASKAQFLSAMEEKRNALTSLKAHKKKYVGSVRTGGVVKSDRPGIVNQENIYGNRGTAAASSSNSKVLVHEDDQVSAGGSSNHSVMRSILDSARKRENTHEAGPWSKAKLGSSKGLLMPSKSNQELGFDIAEDSEEFVPIPCTVSRFQEGIQLPNNHRFKNNPQKEWDIPLVLEEPIIANSIPIYDKIMIYPKPGAEFCPEELRAYKWLKKSHIENNLTKRLDKVWENTYDVGIRLPPFFPTKNLPQSPDDIERMILEDDHKTFQTKFSQIYPESQKTEVSLEELLTVRWKKGLIKTCKEDDLMEVEEDDNMEETYVGNRRQSIYPARKSIAPRKSILSKKSSWPAPDIPESPETQKIQEESEPAAAAGVIKKSIIKRKMVEFDEGNNAKKEYVADTPPRSVFNQFTDNDFVRPTIPQLKPVKPYFDDDDEASPFNQNETCCTQQFNFFIKAQSVSTPISKKSNKLCPDLVPIRSPSPQHQEMPENHGTEVSPKSQDTNSQTPAPLASQTLQQKQLSTIYETTENTQSTKSSVDTQISSPEEIESQITMKKSLPASVVSKLAPIPESSLSFKIFEDKTENVAPVKEFRDKSPISSKAGELPSFSEYSMKLQKYQDAEKSMKLPEMSMKLPEMSMKLPEMSKKSPEMLKKSPKESPIPDLTLKIFEDKTETVTPSIIQAAKQFRDKSPISSKAGDFSNFSTYFMKQHKHQDAEKSLKIPEMSMQLPEMSMKSPEFITKSPEMSFKVPNSSIKHAETSKVPDDCFKLPNISSISPKNPENSIRIPQKKVQEESMRVPKNSPMDSMMSFHLPDDLTTQKIRMSITALRDSTARKSKSPEVARKPYQFEIFEDRSQSAIKSPVGVEEVASKSPETSYKGPSVFRKSFFQAESIRKSQSSFENPPKPFEIFQDTEEIQKQVPEKSMVFCLPDDLTTQQAQMQMQAEKELSVRKSTFGFEIFEDKRESSSKMANEPEILMEALQKSLKVSENSVRDFKVPEKMQEIEEAREASKKIEEIAETSKRIERPAALPFEIFEDKTETFVGARNFEATEKMQEIEKVTESIKNIEKPGALPFEIFEDKTETLAGAVGGMSHPIQNPTNSFHMSRKENFFGAADFYAEPTETMPIIPARKISEEFYELSKTPVRKTKFMAGNSDIKGNSLNFGEPENSMKFPVLIQNIKQEKSLNIEASMKEFSFAPPAPINFEEENINTERFCLNLESVRNSTLLPDVTHHPHSIKKTALEADFNNLSISMEEDELKSLGEMGKDNLSSPRYSDSPKKRNSVEFKIPQLPYKKPLEKRKKQVTVVDEGDEIPDAFEDLSKSIYYPQKPAEIPESPEKWEEIDSDFQQSFYVQENGYQHTMINEVLSDRDIRECIDNENGNPFSEKLRNMMLEKCNFEAFLENHVDDCLMLNKMKPIKAGDIIACGNVEFSVQKLIGKGNYGAIYSAKCSRTKELMALKQERPGNLWEYYINFELFDRLKNQDIVPGFMRIEHSLIANNCSVFASKLSIYGSIIDVCNKIKAKTNKNVDEFIAMVLTIQMLSIIDHLHSCNIIHADIKPDNFLLMEKLEYGSKVPALQLIDFGVAIDMEWYNKSDKFNYVVKTENFTCTEMMEKKPWTYQTDLFGLAGTSHVILFGKYMEVQKKNMQWEIQTRLPRYFNKDVWENFFHTLLNIPDCNNMPNLQDLKMSFSEVIVQKEKIVKNKIAEFNNCL